MAEIEAALAKEAARYANYDDVLLHKPSGLRVRVLKRMYDSIFVEFPRGAKMSILLAMLEAI